MPNEDPANSVAQDELTAPHPIQALLNQRYGNTWANHRRQNEDEPIRVDDLNEEDAHWLLPTLTIDTANHDGEDFTLIINDVILSALEENQLVQHGATAYRNGMHANYRFHLCLSDLRVIRRLASSVENVIARGRSYSDKNLRWICPRTADALYRLADELVELAPDAADDAFSDLYDL